MTVPPPRRTASGFQALDRARTLQVETPEHVGLGFELAGVGSRAAAFVADSAVLILALGLVSLLWALLLPDIPWVSSLGASILVLAVFLIQAGYFFLWEAFSGGRTPGKRWAGLRVVHSGGVPLTIRGAALRNILRPVDLQPFASGLLGLGLIALHSRAQRLGDLAAGTVVVRDRHGAEIPEFAAAERPAGRPALDPERFQVLSQYIARRDALPREVRTRLAARVARAMGAPIQDHPQRRTRALDELLQELHQEELGRQAGGVNRQAVHLVRTRRGDWDRFRALLEGMGPRGLRGLEPEELEAFTSLYRQLTSDLARARTYGASLRLVFELERLVGAGHNLFYRGRGTEGFSFPRWIRTTFPRQVRAHGAYLALSAALLLGPAVWIYAGVRHDPELGRRLAPPAMVSRAEEAGDRMARGEQYVDVPQVMSPLFSSQIMTNNLRVALTAAAGGILAGVGSALILVLNGMHLGSVFALFDHHGAGAQLWGFVLPHGIMELTAIILAGAAGLVLASALFLPGRRTRGDSLRERGGAALSLLGGALLLLVPAGLVEGFISPAEVPGAFKMGFAALVGILLFLWLGLAGRRAEAQGDSA